MKSVFNLVLGLMCVFSLVACNKKRTSSAVTDATFFFDDFDRADGSLGSDWITYGSSATLSILNSMANFNGAGYIYGTYQTPVPSAAYTLSTTYKVRGGDLSTAPLVIVLGNMNTNSVETVTAYVLCGLFGSSRATLYSSIEGTVGTGITNMNYTNNTDITTTLTNDGANNLTCTVSDGSHIETLSYTMVTPVVGTYVGFGGGDSTGSGYLNGDDFIVVETE